MTAKSLTLFSWPLVAALTMTGCGDDGAAEADTEDSTDTEGETDTSAELGTQVLFDLDANLQVPETFYAMPFPSDLRLSPEGFPDLTGMMRGESLTVEQVLQGAETRPHWSAVGATYFVFDGPVAAQDIETPIAADVASSILIIDVDPASPDRGKLYPAIAATLPADTWVPDNMLAVGPYSGVVLPGDRKYAVVVQRSLGDMGGEPLGVPESLATLAAGQMPAGARAASTSELLAPMWETLDMIGVTRTEVAAATVFTVEDIPARTLEMSDRVLAQHDITIDGVALEAEGGADHERFCELVGTIDMPQFPRGSGIYTEDGTFEYDSTRTPIKQRDITIPIVFAIPKQEMPEGGWPLLHYIHGSGGDADQVIQRGKISTPGSNTPDEPGKGLAHLVADHGIASLGAAMPLNPERVPTAAPYDYINIANPSTFPQVFRQGIFEQRLIFEALETFSIDPTALEGCEGASLPASETAHYFNTDNVMMQGQSMGAQYVNLVAPLEARVKAVVPTGAGGLWSRFFAISPLFDYGVVQFTAGLLDIQPDDVNQLHPGVNLIELDWEPGEQIVYANRLAQRPMPGHDARHIYQPVGAEDGYFPETLFDAMAVAYGTQQAGNVVWETMQPQLDFMGMGGMAAYPVVSNRTNEAGQSVTAVVAQYDRDEIRDGHYISLQLDEVKHQFVCFYATYLANGTPTVPGPGPLDAPCPGL